MTIPSMLQPVLNGNAQLAKPMLLLVTMVVDDSGSISHHNNAPAIRRGHNEQLSTYRQHAADNILVKTRYLNGDVLFDYARPADAVRMDESNYRPKGGTPLYDETFNVLQDVLRSAALFSNQFDVYTMTFIMTDGNDQHSRRKGAPDVRAVVERMLDSGRHLVAGLGVRDGRTDFARIFAEMGIPEQFIMVLERTEDEIVGGMRQAAHTSSMIVDPKTFTQTSVTGFYPPQRPSSSDSSDTKP